MNFKHKILTILKESEEDENLFKPRRIDTRPDLRTVNEKLEDNLEDKLKIFLDTNNITTRYVNCNINDKIIQFQTGLNFSINRINQRYIVFEWYKNLNYALINYNADKTIPIQNIQEFFDLILSTINKYKEKQL